MKFSRAFGVELEFNTQDTYGGRYLEQYGRQARIYTQAGYSYSGHNRGELIAFGLEPGWKAVYDSTCGSEIVSPPLMHFAPIRKQLDSIKRSDFDYTFRNTGLHVHVSATDFDSVDVENVARFCRYFDRTIFSFMDVWRRNYEFCRLTGKNNNVIKNQAQGDSLDRYVGCNIAALHKHGTIEFRYAEGTDDAERVAALVDFYIAIMDWVKKNPYFHIKCKPNIKMKREKLLSLLDISESTRSNLLAKDSSKQKKEKK